MNTAEETARAPNTLGTRPTRSGMEHASRPIKLTPIRKMVFGLLCIHPDGARAYELLEEIRRINRRPPLPRSTGSELSDSQGPGPKDSQRQHVHRLRGGRRKAKQLRAIAGMPSMQSGPGAARTGSSASGKRARVPSLSIGPSGTGDRGCMPIMRHRY